MFEHEGGGGGSCVEMMKWTTSGSHLDVRWRWQLCRNNEKNHLRLAFGHEGGGGGAEALEGQKKTTSSSCLDVREVAEASERCKQPPLAHVWMRGRWWRWQSRRNDEKNHLWLMFGHKGGGGGSRVETTKRTTSGSRLDARRSHVIMTNIIVV